MAFEYNGFIHRDLEPQVRYDAEQIELLKQANVDINNKIDTLPLGGEKVSLTFPAGASEGTITADQLTTLQASDANYIEMVNDKELYYLNDPGHEEGFLTYSHVGIENSKATIKTLTITVSAKSFVIVTTVVPTESGKIYYEHEITSLSGKDSQGTSYEIHLYFIKSTSDLITQDTAYNAFNHGFIRGYFRLIGSDKNYDVLKPFFSPVNKYFNITYIDNDNANKQAAISLYPSTSSSGIGFKDTVTEL